MIPFDPNRPARSYRITSADFVDPSDTGEPDAYLSNADRAELGLRPDPSQPAATAALPSTTPTETGNPTRFEMPRPRPIQTAPAKK